MGLSLGVVSGDYSLVAVCRLLVAVTSLAAEHGLCGPRASVVVGHGLSSCGSSQETALQHVESCWIGDPTCVPCIGRWIPHHWTTREVPESFFK